MRKRHQALRTRRMAQRPRPEPTQQRAEEGAAEMLAQMAPAARLAAWQESTADHHQSV